MTAKWERVDDRSSEGWDITERMQIHGGWLYRNRVSGLEVVTVTLVFVPESSTVPPKVCGHGCVEVTCAPCSAPWMKESTR